MKQNIIQILLVLSSIVYIKSKNCDDNTSTTTGEDCILSKEDKEIYDYCCFDDKKYSCFPLTQTDYETKITQNPSMICNDKEPRCENTQPEKASDCVKSNTDKGKYCCYEYDSYLGKSCGLYKDDEEVEFVKYFLDEIVCPRNDNSKYISLKNILLLCLVILL